jgi:hypothetical protein
MADQTEELDSPTGLDVSGLDVPQEIPPAHPEGQEEVDDLVTEEDTAESGQHDEPLLTDGVYAPEDVAEEDADEPAQHNESLEVLTDRVYDTEGTDDPPLESGFSSSSDDDNEDADDDEDADDEGAEQGDDEVDNASNPESQTYNYGLWEPHQEPYRPVLGYKGINDEIYRPNYYSLSKLHPDRRSEYSDPKHRKKMKELFLAARKEPHKLVRPSPLRTASSPDSPVAPKKTHSMVDDVGILPEPSPELHPDEDVVSPLFDRELTSRPQNPSPPESPQDEGPVSPLTDRELNLILQNSAPPGSPKFATGHDWSAEEDSDTEWFDGAIEEFESATGSRRVSLTADQTPADGDDEALSNQQRSPVSPIDPVSNTEHRMVVYGSNLPKETFDGAEASEYVTETPQQTDTAPEGCNPVFVGAEEHDDPEREMSPTSPDFFGPEPLTGKTPQEGIDAWWAWREKNRPAHRTFRVNHNPENQDKKGDLDSITHKDDAVTTEAQRYLAAQRLDVKQLVNMQPDNLQSMARHSHQLSEAIKFDLASALEYVRLRMLKYRYERNRYYEEAAYEHQRVGRREDQINQMTAESKVARRYIDELNTNLWETERAYRQIMAEKESWEPILQEEREKRRLLKAKYQEEVEMSQAYQKAAQSSGSDLRALRARLAAPLRFSSIIEVATSPIEPSDEKNETTPTNTDEQTSPIEPANTSENKQSSGGWLSWRSRWFTSQEPVSESSERPKQPEPLQSPSVVDIVSEEFVSASNEIPIQSKQVEPLQPRFIMVSSQEPVADTSEKPQSYTNDEPKQVTNDELKSDTSEKHKSNANEKPQSNVSQQAKYGKRAKSQRFAAIEELLSRKPVSIANKKPERTKRAKRATPGHLSPFISFEEIDSQGDEPDAVQRPKSAPPTWSSGRPPPHGLAPEHEVNWPLAVRPFVVDFMTEWINNNREKRQPNDCPNPLRKAQLDEILGVGFLSWDRLVRELFNLGYTIRPDHLAQALSNRKNIDVYKLPEPNTAVLYEACRLKKHNAVKELTDENVELKRQLDDLKMPWEFEEKLKDVQVHEGQLLEVVKDLKEDRQYLNVELDKAWEEIERLRKRLSNSTGTTDFGSQADQEEIKRLKNVIAVLQKELEETQLALAEALESSMPDSPPPLAAPITTNMTDIVTKMFGERDNLHQQRNVELSFENNMLREKFDAMRDDIDDLTEKLRDSRANYTLLNKTSSKKIANLEAKLAAGDSSRTGDAKSPLSIEDALAACHEHGARLESDINDLTRKLDDSHAKVADLLLQQGNAGASSDLSDLLEVAEQHAKDLQAKVDELQLQLDEAKKSTPKTSDKYKEGALASIKERKAHRDSLNLQMIAVLEKLNAVSQRELGAANKEIRALKEQAKSHGEPLPTTDEPAPVFPGPAVIVPDQSEDIATLKRELAEARQKNEELGLDMIFMQTSLDRAQEGLKTLRKQVKSEPQEEPAPSSERRSNLYSQGFENDDPSLQDERTRTPSADGSQDLETFVLEQSDSESEETPEKDSETGNPSLQAERTRAPSADGSLDLETFVLEQSDSEAEEISEKDSETGDAGSASGSDFVPDIWTTGPNALLGNHIQASPFRRPDEDVDRDDDETFQEHESKGIAGMSWTDIEKTKEELETAKAAKARRPMFVMKVKKSLPAVSGPTQSQQSPTAVEPETETRTTTQMRTPHSPLAKGERAPAATPNLSEAQIIRRTAMHLSPKYIADAGRKRAIREQHMAERQELITSIYRRAASIFRGEALQYVPAEERYKPKA